MPGRIPGRDVRVGSRALLLCEELLPEVRRFHRRAVSRGPLGLIAAIEVAL
jgi:hypothetical protein